MALSRDGILGADDIQVEKVDVPEWDGTVLIRGLTGEERDAYESSLRQIRNAGTPQQELVIVQLNARANLLVKCLVDESGERVFTDRDAPALGAKNGRIIDRLYDVATRLSGLSDEAAQEIEGNSDGASEGSTSSSPESSDAPSPSSYDVSAPAN
jgi:hypothetical protein